MCLPLRWRRQPLLENGALRLDEHIGPLRQLQRKYRNVPMSVADACIVRMAELHARHTVLTLDSDFSVYRKNGKEPVPLICPRAN